MHETLKVEEYLMQAPKRGLEPVTYAQMRAVEVGIDPNLFLDLIDCESKRKENAIGDGGKAYGILQFWEKTFNEFSKKYNLYGNYTDPFDQIDLALIMIKDGYAYHWTCAKIIGLSR